jgi:outer membrane protein assembly factor BamB
MTKVMGCRLVLLATVLFFSDVTKSLAQGCDREGLVSPELLKAGGLEIVWQNELPIKKGESLERFFIVGDAVYGLSNHNYLISLNRENGKMVFGKPIATVGFPLIGLELYKDKLLSVVGNKLVEISPKFGTVLESRRLEFNAVCPAVRNNLYFYIAGGDGRVHALSSDGMIPVFEVATDNGSKITSVIADESLVVFSSEDGNCISITADRPKQVWEFDAADSIIGPIVRDGNSLFLASKDTNVYKVNVLTGKLEWKYQAEAILDKAPRVTADVVYQYVPDKGLTAIDKDSGKFMWEQAVGVDLLAEANGKAYVITNVGTLVVMDNKKAKQLYSVNFANVSRYAANVADSKIYIADKEGRIACLQPIKY